MLNAPITRPKAAVTGKSYSSLLSSIRKAINQGKRRAQKAVEREKVRTAWEVGKLILDHILLNEARGEYAQSVIQKLSRDLGMSATELRYMVEFARTYSNLPPAGDLSWAHYRELLAINNDEKRKLIAEKAAAADWTRQRLRREIKKLKRGGKISVEAALPDPVLGKVGVYRVIDWLGGRAYDLGFSIRYRMRGKIPKVIKPRQEDLYNYAAKVLSVYDGDTFHAAIDLGFGVTLEQRLRLRRLNAPEFNTRAGVKARKVLEKVLMRDQGKMLIKTTKTDDQYGRYKVDVWIGGVNIDQALIQSELFSVRG